MVLVVVLVATGLALKVVEALAGEGGDIVDQAHGDVGLSSPINSVQ